MACGLARTYPQLVIARMTVGFGEAGGVPPSYAVISDYFPSGRRGTALGIYNKTGTLFLIIIIIIIILE